jgi:hypothetical protein
MVIRLDKIRKNQYIVTAPSLKLVTTMYGTPRQIKGKLEKSHNLKIDFKS